MLKYAKILDETTGLCAVGMGTNTELYKSIGMIEIDVELSDVDGKWYLANKVPMKTQEEKLAYEKQLNDEELKQKLLELDLKSIRAIRANEAEYISKYEYEAQKIRQQLS